MSKLKEVFCYSTSPLGRLSEWVMNAVIPANITIDTKVVDKIETYCWCCALWRGFAVGVVVGLVIGVLL